jgi:nitrate reductase beta subunit
MWWNNVETKPGTGYPTLYEDQDEYRGGWELHNNELRLKLNTRGGELLSLAFNKRLPSLDDYYEPWTYKYSDVIEAPQGPDQPIFTPISLVTGKEMQIEAGPNWDDQLGGSPVYAANDPNLNALSDAERQQMFETQRIVFFYLPRICNHCLNPSCVAACPAGAIYKRGEDGIVLVSQEKCMGWRMCISGCPYKKVYYNWESGKSEKCILCYPRLETQQAPACMHSCPGRIRYLGVLLYDADRIESAAKNHDDELL